MGVTTFTSSGSKATVQAKLDKHVFGALPKDYSLLQAAYEAYLANGRDNLAQALRRGEVSGGGRKPWRQKGTGRARFGSSRNPVWRGGGVAFGPTGNENYTHKITTKAKRQAIRQALSLAAEEKKLIVLEGIAFKDAKTSVVAKLLQKIGATKTTLLVVSEKSQESIKATRNLPSVQLVNASYLNVFDITNADHIVITLDGLKQISDWLGTSVAKTSGDEKV